MLETAIKKLDQKLFEIALAVPEEAYEETQYISSFIASGSNFTLPLHSRRGNLVKGYTVGEGQLEIFLNGQYLTLGQDWLEVGTAGDESITVQIQQDLYTDDLLLFRIDNHTIGGGGDSGGGGEANTASNVGGGASVFQSKVGVDLRFRSLVAGAGISISQTATNLVINSTPTAAALNVVTITGSNYYVLPSNDVILVYNSGFNVNITLPSAATNVGKKFDIKKIDSGNVLSIKGQSGETLDGVDIFAGSWDVLIQYECVSVVSDGLNWFII